MRLWRFSFHSKSKSRTSGGGGGYKLSDNPGQTGEGGSENLDFGRTSFVNGPLVNYGAKMIQVSGPVLWNSIPKIIQDAPSVDNFKDKIKNHFLKQYNC